ncbi:Na(+)/H(+) exchanger beta-like isoform X1 [Argonauta hians]
MLILKEKNSMFPMLSVVLILIFMHMIVPSRSSCLKNEPEVKNRTERDAETEITMISFKFEELARPFIIIVVIMIATLSKLLYHFADVLSSVVPESCMLIIVGTGLGGIIHQAGYSNQFPDFFTPHDFFLFLLPPIILEAAYSLNDSIFFDNAGSVLIFAVIGTTLNSIIISMSLWGLSLFSESTGVDRLKLTEFLIFSAVIVAVDPVAVLAVFSEVGVNSTLYILVFGESLLNDGVSVVLYSVMQAYNQMEVITVVDGLLGFAKFFIVCLGGLLIGIILGILCALLTKFSTQVKIVEPITVILCAFLSYIISDMFELSGIISLIGCGMMQEQYALHNVAQKSATCIKYFVKVASTTSEILIFLFLGIAIVRNKHIWSTGFILWTVFLCLFTRFLVCFTLTYLINRFDRYSVRKIGLDEQFIMSYGGLRGAVCFSLVMMLDKDIIPQKDLLMTTTICVIIFTVVIQGSTIKPLVKFLKVTLQSEDDLNCMVYLTRNVSDHLMAGMEDIVGFHGKYYLKELLEYYDDRYFKKWLQRKPTKADAEIAKIYQEIMLRDHFEHLEMSNAAGIPDYRSRKKDTSDKTKPSLTALLHVIHRSKDAFDESEAKENQAVVLRRKLKKSISTFSNAPPTRLSHARKEMETVIPLQEIESVPADSESIVSRRPLKVSISKTSMITLHNDMKNMFTQNPAVKTLHVKYDPNLTRENKRDILHHLQMKRRATINLANLAHRWNELSEVDSNESFETFRTLYTHSREIEARATDQSETKNTKETPEEEKLEEPKPNNSDDKNIV